MASLSKIKETYYIMYRLNGRQFKKRIGKASKTVALRILRKFEEDLSLKKMGLLVPKAIKLESFFDEYLSWSRTNQAPKTYQIKQLAKTTFIKFIKSNKNLSSQIISIHDLTQDIIEKYKIYRLEKGVKNRTINIELNFLSNCILTAEEWGYVIPNVKIKRLKEDKKIPRYFDNKEIETLLTKSTNHLRQIIVISMLTGLRINELLNLEWQSVDLFKGHIKVSNTNTFKTKTRKERIVPINSILNPYLTWLKNHHIDPCTDEITIRTPQQSKYVVCNKEGLPFKSVRKAFMRFLNTNNIQNATLHTLRHTFASLCVMNNVDLYTIKEFLGHSRVTTTEIYTHISQEFKQTSIEKITPIFSSNTEPDLKLVKIA